MKAVEVVARHEGPEAQKAPHDGHSRSLKDVLGSRLVGRVDEQSAKATDAEGAGLLDEAKGS